MPAGASEEDWLLLRPNLERLSDFAGWFDVLHGEIDPPELSHDERLFVREAAAAAEAIDWSDGPWRALTEAAQGRDRQEGPRSVPPAAARADRTRERARNGWAGQRMGKDRAIERLNAAARRLIHVSADIFRLAEPM